VMEMQEVSVVGVAGWPMMLTDWPVTVMVGVVSLPAADAKIAVSAHVW